ncbi:hypothetical protein NDK50_15110 [Paraburkholderia bryophila]|uniref:hypothetical protein n=1 Tax=Paraburkholderia bryophila TaxID=420952 RepID=UPI0023497FF1|nr:hypothetical protein [Paraburkholderia bryophila]WCM18759.1 hypothetical protein NDK50_15110 [Paraburkholderia bryophila]
MHGEPEDWINAGMKRLSRDMAWSLSLQKALRELIARGDALLTMLSADDGVAGMGTIHLWRVAAVRDLLRRLDVMLLVARLACTHALDLEVRAAQASGESSAQIEWWTVYRCIHARLLRIESRIPRVRQTLEGLAREHGNVDITDAPACI